MPLLRRKHLAQKKMIQHLQAHLVSIILEQEDYKNDVYEKEETNGYYAKTNSELGSTGNYHITYDGKYKYHPNKETKGLA